MEKFYDTFFKTTPPCFTVWGIFHPKAAGLSKAAWESEMALQVGSVRPVLQSQAESSYLDNQSRADKGRTKITPHVESFPTVPGRFAGHLRCSVAQGISPLLYVQHRSGLLKRMCQWKQLELNGSGGGGNLVRIKIRWCKWLPLVGCSEPSFRILTCCWIHLKSFQVGTLLIPILQIRRGEIHWSTSSCMACK